MSLKTCFIKHDFILTEGAVGQRLIHEFGLMPDPDIMYAGLIYDTAGRTALSQIYRSYLQVATQFNVPILLMTNTRRANKERLCQPKFKHVMQDYTYFLKEIAAEFSCESYIGGIMGCKGDAYSAKDGLTIQQAIAFHTWQMQKFNDTIDFFFAGIMPTLPEAIGMANVMEQSGKPYLISLMIQRNGTLLDGHSIHHSIAEIDRKTNTPPLCYMTNCVHPAILQESLAYPVNQTALVQKRFCGIQANAACFDATTLDQSKTLLSSSAEDLALACTTLHKTVPLKIYGGCCGTDAHHLHAIAAAFSAKNAP